MPVPRVPPISKSTVFIAAETFSSGPLQSKLGTNSVGRQCFAFGADTHSSHFSRLVRAALPRGHDVSVQKLVQL